MSDPVGARGYSLTTASRDVAGLFDRAVIAYLGARSDARPLLDSVLDLDPGCVLAHCFDGYLHLLASTSSTLGAAQSALERGRRVAAGTVVTDREASHLAALAAWVGGDFAAAATEWGRLLDRFPRDILTIRVSQFVLSYL